MKEKFRVQLKENEEVIKEFKRNKAEIERKEFDY